MNEWIKVEEGVPELNTWVLAATTYKHATSAALTKSGDWVDQHGYTIRYVTHWQPLPELPE